MNKKFRVEFNSTGFYAGQGVWETLDEIAEIDAETAQVAIDYAIDFMVDSDWLSAESPEALRTVYSNYAWRAAEIVGSNGEYDYNNWQYKD